MAENSNFKIDLSKQFTYGAFYFKALIRKYTTYAFVITMSILALLIAAHFVSNLIMSQEEDMTQYVTLATSSMSLVDLKPPSDAADEVAPPPTQAVVNTGPAARAGNPVPVPDADISPDMKEFADIDDLARASSIGGDGVDLGGFASNIDVNREVEEVNVEVREEEPDIDEFIAVDQEPQIDLAELQKKIKYPEMAREAGIEGRVIVRVLVDENGRPQKHRVEYSDNDMLNDAAVNAIMSSVFTPAIQGNKPTMCWVNIPVNFKLR